MPELKWVIVVVLLLGGFVVVMMKHSIKVTASLPPWRDIPCDVFTGPVVETPQLIPNTSLILVAISVEEGRKIFLGDTIRALAGKSEEIKVGDRVRVRGIDYKAYASYYTNHYQIVGVVER